MGSDLTLQSLTLVNDVHASFFWVMPAATVVLKDLHIQASGPARRFNVAAGGSLRLSSCDLCGHSSEDPYVVYCEDVDEGLICEGCHEQHPGALWAYGGSSMSRETTARLLIPHEGCAGQDKIATTERFASLEG